MIFIVYRMEFDFGPPHGIVTKTVYNTLPGSYFCLPLPCVVISRQISPKFVLHLCGFDTNDVNYPQFSVKVRQAIIGVFDYFKSKSSLLCIR